MSVSHKYVNALRLRYYNTPIIKFVADNTSFAGVTPVLIGKEFEISLGKYFLAWHHQNALLGN